MFHTPVVMEFKHPIFNSAEEYEEYSRIMKELVEEAERETGDPQPEDFSEKKSFAELALDVSRSLDPGDLEEMAKMFNENRDQFYKWYQLSQLMNYLALDRSEVEEEAYFNNK